MQEDVHNASLHEGEEWDSARDALGEGLLSIIMPAYRLGDHIAANIQHVHELFTGRIPFEIIPVDDGSKDNTRSEMERTAQELSEVHPVCLETNAGKGAALRAGFRASRGAHVLLLDGDLDLPPRQVAGFFDIMKRDAADVVIGSKRHPDSQLNYPWYRTVLSNGYYVFIKLLFGLPVRDTQTGIKLFRRPVLDYVFPRMLVKRFAFDLEILSMAHDKGFNISEAPITMDFHGGWGCARPKTVRSILLGTLAVFYRLRILHYYDNLSVDEASATQPTTPKQDPDSGR